MAISICEVTLGWIQLDKKEAAVIANNLLQGPDFATNLLVWPKLHVFKVSRICWQCKRSMAVGKPATYVCTHQRACELGIGEFLMHRRSMLSVLAESCLILLARNTSDKHSVCVRCRTCACRCSTLKHGIYCMRKHHQQLTLERLVRECRLCDTVWQYIE